VVEKEWMSLLKEKGLVFCRILNAGTQIVLQMCEKIYIRKKV